MQAHKVGSGVVVYSRNGHDFTERFPSIAELLRELPAKAAVLDGEVVASDADGRPNLHVRWTGPGTIHLWAFDLLAVNGRDLRSRQLVKRQECLQILLERFGCSTISLSEPFEDGLALLHVAEERGLEGVVSKWVEARLRQPLGPIPFRSEIPAKFQVKFHPVHRGKSMDLTWVKPFEATLKKSPTGWVPT